MVLYVTNTIIDCSQGVNIRPRIRIGHELKR